MNGVCPWGRSVGAEHSRSLYPLPDTSAADNGQPVPATDITKHSQNGIKNGIFLVRIPLLTAK